MNSELAAWARPIVLSGIIWCACAYLTLTVRNGCKRIVLNFVTFSVNFSPVAGLASVAAR